MAIDSEDKRRSALAACGMPWEWGDEILPMGTIPQASRQQVVNVYSGILAAAPAAEDACTKYGVSKYGTFTYCRRLGLRHYRVTFEEFSTNYITGWNLQSPDGTIWTPTLTIGSNVTPTFTWVSGGTTKSTLTPVVVQTDPFQIWTMSIDNYGVVTYTSADNTGEYYGAAIYDENDRVWYFFVDRNTQFSIADDTPYLTIPYLRKAAFELTYETTSLAKASPVNEVVLTRVGTDVAYRIPAWWAYWVPEVDFVQHGTTAIEITVDSTANVDIREVVSRTQTKRLKRRR